jgi:phthalate 4,5-cis-dihydrodiol dehydrogenase
VIDELFGALREGKRPLHDGPWARATLQVCLALLRSAQEQRDVEIR